MPNPKQGPRTVPSSTAITKFKLTPEQELLAIREELARRGLDLQNELSALPQSQEALLQQTQPFLKYKNHPTAFVREVLHLALWSKQREILNSLVTEPRTSVKSCFSAGKSVTAAAAVLWFLYTRPNAIVITTAPGGRQVKEILWREIGEMHSKAFLPGECLQTKLSLSHRWYALGLSAKEPDKFQGFHSPRILLVVDEAAGVSDQVFHAVAGVLASEESRALLIGNPTSTSGYFHTTHHALRHQWKTISISAFDTPNFTNEAKKLREAVKDNPRQLEAVNSMLQGLCPPSWVEARKAEWGEEHVHYQSKVLAHFPSQSEWALIPLDAIEAAQEAPEEFLPSLEVSTSQTLRVGVDVARSGTAENALYILRTLPTGDFEVVFCDFWRSNNLTVSAGRVLKGVYDSSRKLSLRQTLSERLKNTPLIEIRVDATGLGAGVADSLRDSLKNPTSDQRELRELQPCTVIQDIFVGQSPSKPNVGRFVRLRDELWWNTRDVLTSRQLFNLTDSKTQAQLAVPQYTYDSRSRIQIESKDELLKRGVPSPDRADGLVLALAPSDLGRGKGAKVYAF